MEDGDGGGVREREGNWEEKRGEGETYQYIVLYDLLSYV